MDQQLVNFKTVIKRKLVKLKFSNGQIQTEISLSDYDYRILKAEAFKISLPEYELQKLIEDIKQTIRLDPKVEIKYKVLLNEISLGQHIKILTRDTRGEAIEEFISLGENRFLLIYHERGALQITDELRALTSPWDVGGFIDFEVYRSGKRVTHDDDLTVYRTRIIKEIQFLVPPLEYDQLFLSEEKAPI